ncbi:S8 family serine peptidase [Streptomyces sp. NPDC004393]
MLKNSFSDPASFAAQHKQARETVHQVYNVTAGGYALKGYTVETTAEQASALRADPQVQLVEPDRAGRLNAPRGRGAAAGGVTRRAAGALTPVPFVPNDPGFGFQWGLPRIGAPSRNPASVGLAVLDSGVDYTHPDLHVNGAVNFSDSPSTQDYFGHGTHVAGIAAAITNNGLGVAGTAGRTPLWSVKVLDDTGNTSVATVAAGLTWVAQNARALNIRVANLSLGFPTDDPVLHQAVRVATAAGVSVVAAAGDAGFNTPVYPAGYPEVLSVAATAQDDTKISFSNWGADWVDVAAPGASILSTGPTHPNYIGLSEYDYLTGTSQAAPFVAATVALCLTSGRCHGNPQQAYTQVERDTTPIPGTGTQYKYGLIQATCYWNCANLKIAKHHSGHFLQGRQGTYVIAVGDASGAGPTDGTTVTVQDTLPAGLTARSINGSGWTCTRATLTCTRSDVLGAGNSYPPITLTVNASCRTQRQDTDGASGDRERQVTNTATVTGGSDTTTHVATDTAAIKYRERCGKGREHRTKPGQ